MFVIMLFRLDVRHFIINHFYHMFVIILFRLGIRHFIITHLYHMFLIILIWLDRHFVINHLYHMFVIILFWLGIRHFTINHLYYVWSTTFSLILVKKIAWYTSDIHYKIRLDLFTNASTRNYHIKKKKKYPTVWTIWIFKE